MLPSVVVRWRCSFVTLAEAELAIVTPLEELLRIMCGVAIDLGTGRGEEMDEVFLGLVEGSGGGCCPLLIRGFVLLLATGGGGGGGFEVLLLECPLVLGPVVAAVAVPSTGVSTDAPLLSDSKYAPMRAPFGNVPYR